MAIVTKSIHGIAFFVFLAMACTSAWAQEDLSKTEGWISFRYEDSAWNDPNRNPAEQARYARLQNESHDRVEDYLRRIRRLGDQYETRYAGSSETDLNEDGTLELLYPVPGTHETGFPCRPLCNIPVLIVEVVWGENGPEPDPEDYRLVYRGTVFAVFTRSLSADETDRYLFAEPNPHSKWKSITTGPTRVDQKVMWRGEPAYFGGDRYCWTDRPQAIDLSRFNWRRTQEDIRFGFDYEPGQEGYFLRVPYEQECPQ